MAYSCSGCRPHTTNRKKKGGKKGKRKYAKSVSMTGAPTNTKTCKRAFATCVKKKRAELLKSGAVYGDIGAKAESYCRKTNQKVKKACKY